MKVLKIEVRKHFAQTAIRLHFFWANMGLDPWPWGGKLHGSINNLLSLGHYSHSRTQDVLTLGNILTFSAECVHSSVLFPFSRCLLWSEQCKVALEEVKRGPHHLECLLHPQKILSFLLSQVHKDCFSKGGSKSTTLQQVPIKEGLIQSALKLIRDFFLSLCCWGSDQTSVSEMASATRVDILRQECLPTPWPALLITQLSPIAFKGNCQTIFFSQLKCYVQKWFLLKHILFFFLIWKDMLKDYFNFQQMFLFLGKSVLKSRCIQAKKSQITGCIFRPVYHQVIERHVESQNSFHLVKSGENFWIIIVNTQQFKNCLFSSTSAMPWH